ncbi:uncharacterized protein [Rutidosis leptorrhynchoides]|uniref:uncharacterized protein n=1 Tax=Rutidosis leptorrhynchoides TaxID=125765 RepID=UPI003A99F27D
MTLTRLILRSSLLRAPPTTAIISASINLQSFSLHSQPSNPTFPVPVSSLAFSLAEEATAECRHRKHLPRIVPPLIVPGRPLGGGRPKRDPNLPDTISDLVEPRLSLHNRVQSLIHAGDIDNASAVARQSVFSDIRPTVFTCNAIIASMYRSQRYTDAIALFIYFFKQCNLIPNIVSYNYLIISYCENGEVDKALEVYQHIKENAPFSPSAVTFRHLTKGLIDAKRIDEAVNWLWKMLCGKSLSPNVTTYRMLIDAYFKAGRVDEAMEKFTKMVEAGLRVIPTYANKWFSELIENGKIVECEPILTKMGKSDPKPDAATYDIVIRALFGACDYETGLNLVQQMIRYGVGEWPVLKEYLLEQQQVNREGLHQPKAGSLAV